MKPVVESKKLLKNLIPSSWKKKVAEKNFKPVVESN